VTEREAYRVLQVDPRACPEVIRAAFSVLREMCLREDGDEAPRRLAELNLALRVCGGRAAERA
jgi:hypothetical protein